MNRQEHLVGDADGWQELERTVALIERALAGTTAAVSQDRRRDPDTGRLRQIDVTVRGRVGGTDLLVIIECRHHASPQDVTWIEDAIGRRQSLRADKIVLVSSTGFTEGAVLKAQAFGIPLRTLSQITLDDVRDWWAAPHLEWIDYRADLVGAALYLESPADDPATPLPLPQTLEKADNKSTHEFMRRESDGKLMSLLQLLERARSHMPGLHDAVPLTGEKLRTGLKCVLTGTPLMVETAEGWRRLQRVEFIVDLSCSARSIQPSSVAEYSSSPGTPIAQVVQFPVIVGGQENTFSIHKNLATGESVILWSALPPPTRTADPT